MSHLPTGWYITQRLREIQYASERLHKAQQLVDLSQRKCPICGFEARTTVALAGHIGSEHPE